MAALDHGAMGVCQLAGPLHSDHDALLYFSTVLVFRVSDYVVSDSD